MTYMMGHHVYLASGFFNDAQKDFCSWVENQETPQLPIYSPRLDGGVLRPDSPVDEIRATFEGNKQAIKASNWILAMIDNFDVGVIWEMGYAHAIGKSILGFSEVEGRTLNVMLAGCCDLGFVNGRDNLKVVFEKIKGNVGPVSFPRNTWSGSIQ